MTLLANKPELQHFLDQSKKQYGFAALSVISLRKETMADFAAQLAKTSPNASPSELPDYISRKMDLRRDPRLLFPWARSVFIAAVPFNRLPPTEIYLPAATEIEYTGKIAGYAARRDYHQYGRELFAKFATSLAKFANADDFTNHEFQYEICIDTMPVAERALAAFSGLGSVGRNFSLLVKSNGSSCFIAELFTDLDLPDITETGFPLSCSSCNICLNSCKTGALNSKSAFGYQLCRSYLTMENRGSLSPRERKFLGGWIFGCDDCTSCCPESHQPPVFHADIEWLLCSPASEVKKRIAETPLNYAGVTLLRRNSLAVLENTGTVKAKSLISRFSRMTGSELLKKTAREILAGRWA